MNKFEKAIEYLVSRQKKTREEAEELVRKFSMSVDMWAEQYDWHYRR